MNQDYTIPTGENFASFLTNFMKKYQISDMELAKSMERSVYTIERLRTGRSWPSSQAHAHFSIFFTVVMGKDFAAYKKMTRKDKDDIAAKIIAGGGSASSIGGVILLISASGVVTGLSAAGITSGLAAIGGIIGGGMLAGIVVVAAIPAVVGVVLYNIFKPKQAEPKCLWRYKEKLDPEFETSCHSNDSSEA